ncbi:phage capsid protein [Paraburkholderia denitrificans]|uniref:Phage capsid protein n=1 Tax=Paraburkholderia denitrificans TaxID=694025 RepID=A0ABW0JCC9_9BURK
MLKGLSITPPTIGRISIGRVVEKNGKRLPEKSDEFQLTTQVQQRGEWLLHPYDEALRKASGGKLRAIPVRFLFNDPDLNLRAEYSCFDRETGRPVCVGNGETCRRAGENGIEELSCPSPDGCGFAQGGACKPYGRLNVLIGDEDEMGSFIFRTTSYNSIRTLTARLRYFRAVSGNLLACLPLELKLRGKSTAQSYRSAIYYVDLVVRADMTMEAALIQAREHDAQRRAVGFDQAALDEAAWQGFSNGAFEESVEDGSAVVDEFYPADSQDGGSGGVDCDETAAAANPTSPAISRLKNRLDQRAAVLGGQAT